MSLIFYYAPMSTASIITLVLEELQVPCEWIKLDFQKGDTRKPEFLKLNPNGKVPVIVHNGTPIWESAAVTMYLGETFGVDKKLYPAEGTKRGEAMKWIAWANVTLGNAVHRYAHNTSDWVPKEQHNAKAAEAASKEISDCLRVFDQALTGKEYLLGEYTLVDSHLHAFTDWLRHLKIDFSSYAQVNAWSERCSKRPAYARANAREAS